MQRLLPGAQQGQAQRRRLSGNQRTVSIARSRSRISPIRGKTAVRHPLDVLFHDIGVEAIKQKVVRPLTGLKVAPYYGCQVVRPYATFDEAWNPTTMDRILGRPGRGDCPISAQDKVLRRQFDGHGSRGGAASILYSAQRSGAARARMSSPRFVRSASSTWTPTTTKLRSAGGRCGLRRFISPS